MPDTSQVSLVDRASMKLSPEQRRALLLVRRACNAFGDKDWISAIRATFVAEGVTDAVRQHDDGPLYDWLIAAFMFQGISDAVALSYWQSGGGVTHTKVSAGLTQSRCPKLASFWTFEDCGFKKTAWTCNVSAHLRRCRLPRHDLRNGRLNQTAYSLRLFMRDICGDDLVAWIDHRLSSVGRSSKEARVIQLGQSVVEPLKGIVGVSDKVLSMALSDLLIGADPSRSEWVAAGAGMIVIDTLVHNLLHRTGTLAAFDAEHPYGPACYGPDGCAPLVRNLAKRIDARRFNRDHPPNFPRFVQHAIWRFCAKDHDGRCNGVRIDDRLPCNDRDCPLGDWCARTPLNPQPSVDLPGEAET